MKNLGVLIVCITISFSSYGKIQLFEKDVNNKIVATINPENTIGLKLNNQVEANIINNKDRYIQLQLPTLSVLSDSIVHVFCNGDNTGEIIMNYIPGSSVTQSSFLWTGPNGFTNTSQSINNLIAGNYYLELIENNVDTNYYFYIVTEPFQLVVTHSIQDVNCFGGNDATVVLSINGGVPNYFTDWYGNNPLNLSAGSYTYTVTDQNNCSLSSSIFINQPNQPIATTFSSTNVSCFNGNNGTASLSVTGGTAPYTTLWQNSSPNQLTAGPHSYTIIDTNGCIYQDTVIIYQPADVSVIESVINAKCYNEASGSVSLMISGGYAPYIANWYGVNINSLLAGSYIYEVVDSNSCVKSGIVVVSEPSKIIVSSIVTPATCSYLNDGSVNVNILGGIPPYNIDWLGNNPQQLNKGTYNFLVVDSNLCVDSNQVFVYSISDIQVQEEIVNVSCHNNCDGEIGLLISNGFAPYQIELQNLNNIAVPASSLCEGQYTYKVVDDLMCEFIDTFNVVNPDLIQLFVSVNGNILEANVTGGVFPYYYSWYDTSTYIGNAQELTVNYNGEFTCIVYDSNYCFTDSVTINTLQTTGVENDTKMSFLVYPNPTRDIVNIESGRSISNIYMTDILGKRLKLNSVSNKHINKIDCSNLAKGIYLLNFNISESQRTIKVIVE